MALEQITFKKTLQIDEDDFNFVSRYLATHNSQCSNNADAIKEYMIEFAKRQFIDNPSSLPSYAGTLGFYIVPYVLDSINDMIFCKAFVSNSLIKR